MAVTVPESSGGSVFRPRFLGRPGLLAAGFVLLALLGPGHPASVWGPSVWGQASADSLPGSAGEDAGRGEPLGVDTEVVLETLTNPRLERSDAILVWNTDARPAWRAALRHPESQLRREVADSIRQAHRLGMPGLVDLRDELLSLLRTPDETVDVKVAAAAALIELGCDDLAEEFAVMSARGPLPLQRVVEPALARWSYRPAVDRWLDRVRRVSGDPGLLRLAIESLGEIEASESVEPLAALLMSPLTPASVRLAAARALATLAPVRAVGWSRRLASGVTDDAGWDRQLAAELLAEASGEEAMRLLEELAGSDPDTVAAVAFRRMFRLDPRRVLAMADLALAHRDANVRRVAIEALGTDSEPPSIARLTSVLSDPVPDLRRLARRTLLRHAAAGTGVGDVVIGGVVPLLESESWRATEQAIILLTVLQQQQIHPQLMGLVDHPRPEVQVAAAWGLKHRSVPAQSAAVLSLTDRVSAEFRDPSRPTPPSRSTVQAHLFEALGWLEDREAISSLAGVLPKSSPIHVDSRAAAVWALGYLLRPESDAPLIRGLEERLSDASSVPPEDPKVRYAAALALGRIGDPASLPVLRRWYQFESLESHVGRSCGWAISRITGEPMEPMEPRGWEINDWPLQPLARP